MATTRYVIAPKSAVLSKLVGYILSKDKGFFSLFFAMAPSLIETN